jgi:DNA-binding NarL/FixJ family response regulator
VIRVLLVDDQPLVREGLRRILEPEPGIEIVGECEDGDQVRPAVGQLRPDVVIMDVRMRRTGGAEATRQLRQQEDAPPVLILTTFDDDDTVAAALAAGAAGFILKDAPGEDIVRATTIVAGGGSWLDSQIVSHVLAAYRRSVRRSTAANARTELLTQREFDVLRQVGSGATNAEVAENLFISEATVKTHLANVLAKLELRDRAALIVFAQSHVLVDDGQDDPKATDP